MISCCCGGHHLLKAQEPQSMILMRMKARETAAVSGHGTPVHCLMMVPQEAVRHTANQLGSLRRGLADKSSYADVQTLLGKVRIWHRFSDSAFRVSVSAVKLWGWHATPCLALMRSVPSVLLLMMHHPDVLRRGLADKSSHADVQRLLGKVLSPY